MAPASNTVPPQTENAKLEGQATTRPNPVALETLVTVTGARPSSEGSRDLFTEETKTILVFADGAVIQLAAAVSVGQLLFLTNKKSNEEVVCQIIHKRIYRPTVCYVELQFTEEKPNFWGVAFPKGGSKRTEFAIAEHVGAEETTEDDPGTPVPTQSEDEVQRLKSQVEALRKQLRDLEQRNAEGLATPAKAAAPAPVEEKAPKKTMKEELAPVNDPVPVNTSQTSTAAVAAEGPSAAEALLMPGGKAEGKPGPKWTVPMALPNQGAAEVASAERAGSVEKDPSEELLPKPELDFSKVPAAEVAKGNSPAEGGGGVPRAVGRARIRLYALLAILVAGAGVSAHLKVWEAFPAVKNTVMGLMHRSNEVAVRKAAPKPVAAQPTVPVKSAPMAAAGSEGGNGAAVTDTKNDAKAAPAAETGQVTETVSPGETAKSAEATPEPETKTNSGGNAGEDRASKKVERSMARRRGAKTEAGADAGSVEAAATNAAPTVAKLLRAATPVYPPDAMRHFITGDVKAELVVQADGKVGEVKVISGPKALRDAAVEALKRYEYAAATQGGRAVASKTTATVKFWFNP